MDDDVTDLLGDQVQMVQTDRIAAGDAASVVNAVRHAHKNVPKRFELLAVLLMEPSGFESRAGAAPRPRFLDLGDGGPRPCRRRMGRRTLRTSRRPATRRRTSS